MPTTAPSVSAGVDRMRRVLLSLILAIPSQAIAQDYADGSAAYALRDWPAAETLWKIEVASGSPEAMLGLGNLYDFGLLGESDPERALDLYRQAANLGLEEATFNVAVMKDAGIGVSRDLDSAVAWYSFAALGGHARAAYNLGLLFAEGSGIPQNTTLARFWLQQAASSVPAAQDVLNGLPVNSALTSVSTRAPRPLEMQMFDDADAPLIRMAWLGEQEREDSKFRVELVLDGLDGFQPWRSVETIGSAIALPLAGAKQQMAWRVSRVSETKYAASEWQFQDGRLMESQPVGTVRFAYNADDRRAEGLAYRLGGAMRRFGAIISYEPTELGVQPGPVTYSFEQDANLASDVAAFLPGIVSGDASLNAKSEGKTPGEVRVTLAFSE